VSLEIEERRERERQHSQPPMKGLVACAEAVAARAKHRAAARMVG
jgi:hypothetical protein